MVPAINRVDDALLVVDSNSTDGTRGIVRGKMKNSEAFTCF